MWFKSPCAQTAFKGTRLVKHMFSQWLSKTNRIWCELVTRPGYLLPQWLPSIDGQAWGTRRHWRPWRRRWKRLIRSCQTGQKQSQWHGGWQEQSRKRLQQRFIVTKKHSRPSWPQQPHPVPHQIIHKIIFDLLVLPSVCKANPTFFWCSCHASSGVASNWKAVTARHPKIDRIP